MTRVASFHLATFPKRRAISKMISLPAERWELSQSPGCVFGKVLGTSRQGTTRISVDLSRWAILAVWEDPIALKKFLDSSPIIERWNNTASTFRHFELTPLMSHGSWSGVDPFPAATRQAADPNSPIAVLTHANIRATKAWSFMRAVPSVDDDLNGREANQLALGIGEWPFFQQATFSIWENEAAIREFAYSDSPHAAVIKRARKEGWFTEELFSRFAAKQIEL